jgi:hypothetical protein
MDAPNPYKPPSSPVADKPRRERLSKRSAKIWAALLGLNAASGCIAALFAANNTGWSTDALVTLAVFGPPSLAALAAAPFAWRRARAAVVLGIAFYLLQCVGYLSPEWSFAFSAGFGFKIAGFTKYVTVPFGSGSLRIDWLAMLLAAWGFRVFRVARG